MPVTPLSLKYVKSKTPETECKKKDCAFPVRSDKAWAKPLGHLAWACALVGPGVATPLLPRTAILYHELEEDLVELTPLPAERIAELLQLCLKSTYFSHNGELYEQRQGAAIGSPVWFGSTLSIKLH